eukprot:1145626-Pelagomonas_calceolata.AAC.4
MESLGRSCFSASVGMPPELWDVASVQADTESSSKRHPETSTPTVAHRGDHHDLGLNNDICFQLNQELAQGGSRMVITIITWNLTRMSISSWISNINMVNLKAALFKTDCSLSYLDFLAD